MNILLSKNFIIGIICIGVVSGCAVKNIDPNEVNKSSALKKNIEPPEDLTKFSNPKEQLLLEETMLGENSGQKNFKQEPNPKKQSNPFLDSGNQAQKNVMANFSAPEVLDHVFFNYDKYNLSKTAKKIVIKNAEWLKKNPFLKIQLEGHCDERGTNNYNIALGEKRASYVKRQLEVLGIDKDRISTVSYGEEKPFCVESKEICWSQNRRVQFLIRTE